MAVKSRVLAAAVAAILAGCAANPDTGRRELTPVGRVALQEGLSIAVRQFVGTNEKGAQRAAKIRAYAGRLYGATSYTTVTDIRKAVDAELAKASMDPLERADWQSFLNIAEAVLREQIGRDEIDSEALVRVNDYLAMIVAALPPPPDPA